jgi:uncharacterized protein YndB with AHSA1/START domain
MAHAQNTVTVNRPVAEVYEYLADGANDPQWREGVLEIERTSGDGGLGTTYRQVMAGPGGRKIRGDYRVTAFQPPRRFEFQVIAGPARPAGRFELAAAGASACTVTFTLDLQPRGLMRLMSPLVARQMRTEVAQLDRLPQAVESA